MKIIRIAAIIILFTMNISAAEISGIIKDAKTNEALSGATITLNQDSDVKYGERSKSSGKFAFKDIKAGTYSLKITYIGYAKFEQSIKLSAKQIENLGTLSLSPEEITTEDVLVTAKMPIGETKEDTTIFNAGAYKTNPDATAEDLVKKMPGVQVDASGTVKSQGETVKKVLVDGKPFFGDDPTVALKNIPADVIDKIQIYDKLSDQAEFSGFDDGNTDKAMNIITKSYKRYGQFGKLNAGYGTDDKYAATGTINVFNGDLRWTVLALSNNTNQTNFSIEDIVGAYSSGGGNRMPRPPGGGQPSKKMTSNSELRPTGGMFENISSFMVSPTDGIAKTNSIGTNFSDLWFNDKVEFNGSYFFNNSHNDNEQLSLKDYYLSADSIQNYDQSGTAGSDNYNHRVNFKIKYAIDEDNSIMFRNSIGYQNYESNGDYNSFTLLNRLDSINSAYGYYGSNYNGLNLSNTLSYRHRFDTSGRILTINLSTSYNEKDGNSFNNSYTTYYSSINSIDTIDQKADNNSNTFGYGLELTYAEPLSEVSQLQLVYSANKSNSNSNTRTLSYNALLNDYSSLDSTLSNETESDYITQKAGITYKLKGKIFNMSLGTNYQNSSLNSDQVFPNYLNTKRTFDNFLPNAQIRFKFNQRTNLRFDYRTSTLAPSITQLQDVIDNSTSTQLTSGNINLQPQYSHTLNLRFHNMSENMSNIFMTMFAVNFRNNYITNSYLIATKDTMLNATTKLASGSQFSKPINLNGYWDSRAFINYGFPVGLISSNLNLGTGITYTHTPSLVNNVESKSDAWSINSMFNLGSNISENLDFNANLNYNYNITKNQTSSKSSNHYSTIGVGFDMNWIIWEGFFVNANFRSTFYKGDNVNSANSDSKILNFSVGKKLFNNMFELRLTANDLLDNNKSYSTDYSEYYTQTTTNTVLKKYVLLSLTYNLKNFSGTAGGTNTGGMPDRH